MLSYRCVAYVSKDGQIRREFVHKLNVQEFEEKYGTILCVSRISLQEFLTAKVPLRIQNICGKYAETEDEFYLLLEKAYEKKATTEEDIKDIVDEMNDPFVDADF